MKVKKHMSTLATSRFPERAAALLATMILVVAPASAGCDLSIERAEAPAITLDPFDARVRPSFVTVEVSNRGEESCLASVALRDTLAGNAGASSRDGVQLEFYGRARAGRIATGVLVVEEMLIGAGETKEVRFAPQIGFTQVPKRGERRFELTAEVVASESNTPVSFSDFDLNVFVAPATSIVLAGMSADRTLNLGDLRAGGAATANFYVQSNGPYRVAVRSETQGLLQHAEDRNLKGVRYQVTTGNQTTSLARPLFIFKNEATTVLGDRMSLMVRTEPNPLLFAGVYKDVIEVEVTPY
ncbi:MAG: hypothetical protein RLO80_07355 [Hyphomonas sp.]